MLLTDPLFVFLSFGAAATQLGISVTATVYRAYDMSKRDEYKPFDFTGSDDADAFKFNTKTQIQIVKKIFSAPWDPSRNQFGADLDLGFSQERDYILRAFPRAGNLNQCPPLRPLTPWFC